MQYVTQPKTLTVIELHVEWNGLPKGTRIIQEDGGIVFSATTAEWEAMRAVPASTVTNETARAGHAIATARINRTKETLTVPKAFAMTPTSEKVLKVIGQTPMSTGDIARVSRLNKSSVSRELGRLTKADLVEKHGAGMYSIGRVSR